MLLLLGLVSLLLIVPSAGAAGRLCMLVLWSLGPVVVVDDLLLLLLVLRSELMLESDDGLVVELELMVELEGDDVEVSELIGELAGGLEAPGPPVVAEALLLDCSSDPVCVVALALVPLLELIAELDVLSVLAEVPTPAFEELLADWATADVATHSVMTPTANNHTSILPFFIHFPPRVFL